MDLCTHVETLRRRTAECPLTRHQLADLSGGVFSASWVSKFISGAMDNPRLQTLLALESALDAAREKRAA